MPYQPTSLRAVPLGSELLQDLAITPLKEADLSRKYGFMFEKVSDDISSSEVCVIKSKSGQHFLIVCRSELPEWEVVIRSSRSAESLETYVPRMLADFIESTGFDAKDIKSLWSFKQ